MRRHPDQLYIEGPVLAEAMGDAQKPSSGGAPVLLSITVTPANPTFTPTASSDRLQMTATGHYDVGGDQDITTTVTWTSGTEAVATVSNGAGTEGEVAAVAGAISSFSDATSVITATLGAVSGNTTVKVEVNNDNGYRLPINAYQLSIMGETPTALWLLQEASGNAADSMGTGFTLTANTTPLYSQAVAGFARVAVGTDNATNDGFYAASGVGPNPTTTSSLWVFLVKFPAAPASNRDSFGLSDNGANGCAFQHTTGDKPRINIQGNVTAGANNLAAATVLCGLQYDRTNSKANAYVPSEKMTGTYGAGVVDGNKGIAAGPANAGDQRYLWGIEYSGAGGEKTTLQVRTLFEKITKTQISAWS